MVSDKATFLSNSYSMPFLFNHEVVFRDFGQVPHQSERQIDPNQFCQHSELGYSQEYSRIFLNKDFFQ